MNTIGSDLPESVVYIYRGISDLLALILISRLLMRRKLVCTLYIWRPISTHMATYMATYMLVCSLHYLATYSINYYLATYSILFD